MVLRISLMTLALSFLTSIDAHALRFNSVCSFQHFVVGSPDANEFIRSARANTISSIFKEVEEATEKRGCSYIALEDKKHTTAAIIALSAPQLINTLAKSEIEFDDFINLRIYEEDGSRKEYRLDLSIIYPAESSRSNRRERIPAICSSENFMKLPPAVRFEACYRTSTHYNTVYADSIRSLFHSGEESVIDRLDNEFGLSDLETLQNDKEFVDTFDLFYSVFKLVNGKFENRTLAIKYLGYEPRLESASLWVKSKNTRPMSAVKVIEAAKFLKANNLLFLDKNFAIKQVEGTTAEYPRNGLVIPMEEFKNPESVYLLGYNFEKDLFKSLETYGAIYSNGTWTKK